MSTSAAININTPPGWDDGSAHGRNPFLVIEKNNYEQHVVRSLREKWVKTSVLATFNAWDNIVSARLKQLCHALMPDLLDKPHTRLIRACCRLDWAWLILGPIAKFRIVRARKEGSWEIELFNTNGYTRYHSRSLTRVSFVLNDHSAPIAFHLCRGADNKVFNTLELTEEQLNRTLLCHFSRLSCGSDLEEDLIHLTHLKDNKTISEADFVHEKKSLLCNKPQAKIYMFPSTSARETHLKENRIRVLFSIFCVLLMATILMYARLYAPNTHIETTPSMNHLLSQ